MFGISAALTKVEISAVAAVMISFIRILLGCFFANFDLWRNKTEG
ncbi:MAG: hypothetical protein ACJAR1_002344 [Rubritalea sp.]|jgi:hypothetical protein